MNEEDVDFNILDEDDDIFLCNVEDQASTENVRKEEEMPVDLDGIDFDEEMEGEEEANISIGLGTVATTSTAEVNDVSSGFDVSAGKLWIYPTNYPIRDYQYNIVQQALYKNTLVVLPTGLGKTFIAAVAMYNLYRWFPQGKIVFMAPTKPLVAQQIMACYNIMGIPKGDTVEMTGNMPPATRQKAWRHKRVVFLTPQVMTNDLSRGSCTAESIKCLVIDEAHKALGNHAYCQVVRELVKFTREFRVLALSATPGSDLKAVQQVMNNLLISHIELRTEDSIDIRPYTHERKVDKIVVPLGEELSGIRLQYIQIMTYVTQRLTRNRVLYNREATRLSKFLILKARDEFRQNPPQNMQQIQFGNIEADFALAISLYHGFELLQLHGLRSLYNFLTGIVTGEKGYGRTRSELLRNADFNDIMEKLRQKFSGSGVLGASTSLDQKVVVGHPKMQRLEEIVVEHFTSFQKRGQETRVMIFSQYRDSVQEISAILNQHQPLVKVMPFIGQSSAGKATKGYTQKEQLKVMQQFRQGGYNTLVSTCVGEEGLDIGDVDLIVCFDAHKSPIRLVQRMGRTGRKRQGRIVMLVTEGKEEQIYNQSLHSKKSIHKAILNGARSLHFYPSNPRLVPTYVSPQCHKMHITVNTAKMENKKLSPSKTTRTVGNKSRNISNMFGKQAKQAAKDGHLTQMEYEEISREFLEAPDLAKHLPARKFLIFSSQAQIAEGKKKAPSSSSVINVSEWMPWQNRLQKTHIVGHSSRSLRLVKDAEFIELQQCLPSEEDSYGVEMRKFFNQSAILHENEIEGKEGQSSIVSFLTPNQKKGIINQKKQKNQKSSYTDLGTNSHKRLGNDKQRKNSETEQKDKETATAHIHSIIVNSDSSLDGSPCEPSEAPAKVKHSSLFTEFTDRNLNSRGVNVSEKTVNKTPSCVSKSRKKTQNNKALASDKKVKKKVQSKKKLKCLVHSMQEVKSEASSGLKNNIAKKSSILQLLETSNRIVPCTKDSADFENAEDGGVAQEMETEGEKQLTKENSQKEICHLTVEKDDEYDHCINSDASQKRSDDCNSFWDKTSEDKNVCMSEKKNGSEIATESRAAEMPLVPAAPPISEVKILFQNLKSGSEFTTFDLEELVKEWADGERKTCEAFARRSQEFLPVEKCPESRNMQVANDRSSENLQNMSCETELLAKHCFSTPDFDSSRKIKRTSLHSSNNEVCDTSKKNPSYIDGNKVKKDNEICMVKNNELEYIPSRLEESNNDIPKSPIFKRNTSQIHFRKEKSAVVNSVCFPEQRRNDTEGQCLNTSQSHTLKGMPKEKVSDSLNLTNMSDFFESSFNDLGDEAERSAYSKTVNLSINMSGVRHTQGSAAKPSKISTSLLSFTQALDFIHTSSSENSPDDAVIDKPTKLNFIKSHLSPVNQNKKRKTSERFSFEKSTRPISSGIASEQKSSEGEIQKGLNLNNLKKDFTHQNKQSEELESGNYNQTSEDEIAVTNKLSDLVSCHPDKASSPCERKMESDLHYPPHENMTTPQKYSVPDDDIPELPQFDLGFDLDDDIIPPTPEKNSSQASIRSLKCEVSIRKFSHDSETGCIQNAKDRVVTSGFGASSLNPMNQSDENMHVDNKNIDQLEDTFEVNDFNLVLSSDDSETEEQKILEKAESKQIMQVSKEMNHLKRTEHVKNTEETQLPSHFSVSIMETSAEKLSELLKENGKCSGSTSIESLQSENESDSSGIHKTKMSVNTNKRHCLPIFPCQDDDKGSNKHRVPSPPKHQNLPFSRYNLVSHEKVNLQLQNEKALETFHTDPRKSRTTKLKLENKKTRFREVNQNDDDSSPINTLKGNKPKEMSRLPLQSDQCRNKLPCSPGKDGASHKNKLSPSFKLSSDNGIDVKSDLQGDEEEMFALYKEDENNGCVRVSTPIKSSMFFNQNANCQIMSVHSPFRENPVASFSAQGSVKSVNTLTNPNRKEKMSSSTSSLHLDEGSEVKSSTPVLANAWLSKNARCKEKDMGDLTPIKKSLGIHEEVQEDGSDESFIIRRRKKVTVTLNDSSEHDEISEESPKTNLVKSKLKTKRKQVESNSKSDSSSHGDNSKSTSDGKQYLSVLGDFTDDMDDFEDNHSVVKPQKQILKEEYNGPKRKKKTTGFIEQEAEVSGEEGSSDEHEGMDDYYEASFIDNNTEMSQAQATDMRAVYLRSVKSPPIGGGANRFKLKYKSKHVSDMDIYSQALPEDHGMSDYEEDSFCVGSDDADISYMEDETQLEVHTKKKVKPKTKTSENVLGKKRRIRMMSNSSSDEEENRIQMTQEFASASHKLAKRAIFSSSEDEKDKVAINDSARKLKSGKKAVIMERSNELSDLQENTDNLVLNNLSESKSNQATEKSMRTSSKNSADKQKISPAVNVIEILDDSEKFEDNWTKIKTSVTEEKTQPESLFENGNFDLLEDDDWLMDFDPPLSEIVSTETEGKHEMESLASQRKMLSLKNSSGNSDRCNNRPRESSLINKIGPNKNFVTSEPDNHANHAKDLHVQNHMTRAGMVPHDCMTSVTQSFSSQSGIAQSNHDKDGRVNRSTILMSREERLRKQKEKQERFRQKLQQVEQIKASSSFSDNSAVKTMSPEECADRDYMGNKRNVSASDVNSADQTTIVDSNKSNHTSPSFTKIMQTSTSTTQLQILVDSKEISGAQDIISALRIKHNIKVTARQLPHCDYVVSNHLAVDRMQWSTFSNSTNRSKLSSRICEMQGLYDRCVLIVESDKVKGQEKNKRPIHHTKYLDTSLSYLVQTRIKMYFTDSVEETAALLSELCHVEGRKGRSLAAPASLTTKKEEMFNFMLSIPKVTVPQALNIVHRFRNIAELITSPAPVIQERGHMSTEAAQSIYRFLRYQFDLQMTPISKR